MSGNESLDQVGEMTSSSNFAEDPFQFGTRGHSASIAEMASGDTFSMDSLPVRAVEYPPGFQGKSRRSSVSAESDRPAPGTQVFQKKVIPKPAEAMDRIIRSTAKSILFSGLEEAQKMDIYNAMEEMKVNEGEVIIQQFLEGDYFYVIDSGKFNVYKRDNANTPSEENDGHGKQVFQYESGGSFGELALMYNCGRAATVRAATPGILWRVDRETFRHIIIDSSARKRQAFESFLETIPLLSSLSKQERAQIADALETVKFSEGELIIKQGDDGDKLYLILEGKAKATQTTAGTVEAVEVGRMNAGQYFGERSLITREPRAANVIAISPMTCAAMDRSAFERLLGPLKDIMRTHAAKYAKAEDVIKGQKAAAEAAAAASSAPAVPVSK